MRYSLLIWTAVVSVVIPSPIDLTVVKRRNVTGVTGTSLCDTAFTLCCFGNGRNPQVASLRRDTYHPEDTPHSVNNCYPTTSDEFCHAGNGLNNQVQFGNPRGEVFCCASYDSTSTQHTGNHCKHHGKQHQRRRPSDPANSGDSEEPTTGEANTGVPPNPPGGLFPGKQVYRGKEPYQSKEPYRGKPPLSKGDTTGQDQGGANPTEISGTVQSSNSGPGWFDGMDIDWKAGFIGLLGLGASMLGVGAVTQP